MPAIAEDRATLANGPSAAMAPHGTGFFRDTEAYNSTSQYPLTNWPVLPSRTVAG